MPGVRNVGVMILLVFLTVHLTSVVYAQSDLSGAVVEGIVFEDLNNDLIHNEGEPGLSAVLLEFTDGSDRIIQIETGEDGSFLLQLEPRLWRVLVQPPSGFQVVDTTGHEFLITDDISTLLLDIALTKMGDFESDAQDEDTVGNEELTNDDTATPIDTVDNDETGSPEVDDTQQAEDESQDNGGFYILPESGGKLPAKWVGLLASIALLTTSLIIISIGRKLRIESDLSNKE